MTHPPDSWYDDQAVIEERRKKQRADEVAALAELIVNDPELLAKLIIDAYEFDHTWQAVLGRHLREKGLKDV